MATQARFEPLCVLGRGGMATVELARMSSAGGFHRLVTMKTLHGHLANDREVLAQLLEEARLSALVRHPNVVATLDVVARPEGPALIQEYVDGVSLGAVIEHARSSAIVLPVPVVVAIACETLRALGAVHDAVDERGEPLHLLHRDISPQNILVGTDGAVRIIDFGIARAVGRAATTAPKVLAGKLPYMAPEQVLFRPITKQVDLYAVGAVLWEMLTGERLIPPADDEAMIAAILRGPPPAALHLERAEIPAALDAIVRRALDPSLQRRFRSAADFEAALLGIGAATTSEVAHVVRTIAGAAIDERRRWIAELERADEPRSKADLLHELVPAPGRAAHLATPPPPATRLKRRLSPISLAIAFALLAAGLIVTLGNPAAIRHASASPAIQPSPPGTAPGAGAATIVEVKQDIAAPSAMPAASSAPSPTARSVVRRPRMVRPPAGAKPTPSSAPSSPSPPSTTARDPGEHL